MVRGAEFGSADPFFSVHGRPQLRYPFFKHMAVALLATVSFASDAQAAGVPAVLAIDATGTLYSYDVDGAPIAHSAVGGPVSSLNGGGIAVVGESVYVTLGQYANQVAVFDAATLRRIGPPPGAFGGLFVPRGIALDWIRLRLYVGNGGGGVLPFTLGGTPVAVSFTFPGQYGPSGIAYDSHDNTIWVANYFGAPQTPPAQYSVTEYRANGRAAATFDYASQFVPPFDPPHEQPYAIAVCGGYASAPLIEVGFISDTSDAGTGEVQAYTTRGAPKGLSFAGVTNPNALSCSYRGQVYVADNAGLLRFDSLGTPKPFSPTAFAGMTAPIYGVFAR